MTELFFRDGRPFTGTAKGEAKAPYTMVAVTCDRCGGQGGSEAWRHTGWTCYKCGGARFLAPRQTPLYTAEKLGKLNATRDKRLAAKAEKARMLES